MMMMKQVLCRRVLWAQVTLHWPLSLAVSPIDNTLHILDNSVVLKVTADSKVLVVAGRLLHCPLRQADSGLVFNSADDVDCLSGCPAVDAVLHSPQHLAFAPDGQLYVVENGTNVSRVRSVDTDGLIRAYIGGTEDAASEVRQSRDALNIFCATLQVF